MANKSDVVASFLSVEDALTRILDQISPISAHETIPLSQALGRVTAEDIISPISVPAFNNSAMDGYAVRSSEVDSIHYFPVAGKILAGQSADLLWPAKSCIRIMTGAPVPKEADAVIMQEETEPTENGVRFTHPVKLNQNIRFVGEDVKEGTQVFPKGHTLSIPDLSLLCTLGIANINVKTPVKIALFSTGDELCSVGAPLGAGKIYDSNRFTLNLMLNKLGCEVIDLGIIPDDPTQLRQAFLHAAQSAEMIISSGGVSVGEADFTKNTLNALGHVDFWKIAIKPGKPFAFGKIKNSIFCGLPGNPVSALVTFYQFVYPAIKKLSGQSVLPQPIRLNVKNVYPLKKRPGRVDFQRGILSISADGEAVVSSTGAQGSHLTHSLSQANCFIVLEKERGNVDVDECVTVELFNALLTQL